MKKTECIVIASLWLSACGSPREEKPAENDSLPATDTVSQTATEEETEFIADTDSLLAQVVSTDSWINQHPGKDTVPVHYVWTDEYDESWKITVYENARHEYHSVSLILKDDDPFTVMDYRFDKDGHLCRLDYTEIRKHSYRDEVYKYWYINPAGSAYWLHHQHLYTTRYLVDTAYLVHTAGDEEEGIPMFFTKKWVDKHIRSLDPVP